MNQNIVDPKNNNIIPIIEKVPKATNASVIFVIAFPQLIVPALPKQELNVAIIDANNLGSVITASCFVFATVPDATRLLLGATSPDEEGVTVFIFDTGIWLHPVATGTTIFASSEHILTSVPSSTHIRHVVVSTIRAL